MTEHVDQLHFMAEGGACGNLIRSFDWSASELGPPRHWPDGLKTLVGVMLTSNLPMLIVWGPRLTTLYNDGYAAMCGQRHPAAMGHGFDALWFDIWDQVEPILSNAYAGIPTQMDDITFVMHRNGYPEETHFAFSYTPVRTADGVVAGMFCACTETTQSVLAKRRLDEDRERQRLQLQQMPGFAAVLAGPEHVFEYVNEAYKAIAGMRDFVGRTVREVFPELAGQGFYELLDRVYATGQPFVARALPIRLTGNEAERYIDLLYQPTRDEREAITGIFVGGYDTTERVRAEQRREALVRLTDRIGDIGHPDDIAFAASETVGEMLKVGRVGYGTIDGQAETLHVVRDWNAPGVESLRGVHSLRDYGSFIDTLKNGELVAIQDVDRDDRTAAAAEALKTRKAASFVNVPISEQGRLVAVLFVNHAEIRVWRPEELDFIREVAARTRIAVERSRNDAALHELNATLKDRIAEALREQSETAEALRQSQKMEAVGQLTGGLAHDFNNLLAGISGSLDMMQTRLAQGRVSELERYMVGAQGAAKRAAALTHRLLAFSRRQTLSPKPTDINRLAADMEELIQRTVGPSIVIETVAKAGLWSTLVDPPQLENALLNLCINARDAMPDGGRITIETANRWLDDRTARERDLSPGQYVSLCVSDTGTGMTRDVIEKAFDPFFTTKPIGLGTGLGLSMIYGFARQSGGQVRIYSEVGEGTTVCIYLPRHLVEERPMQEPATAEIPKAEAGETVLVIDDEPLVRMLVVDVLEELGYRTLEAADGPQGLKIIRSDARIDLLVTDVGLPNGMNGRQVADAAREVRPDLKVLFVTGYAENAVLGHGHLAAGMQVVTKPFDVNALANKVKAMIEAT